MADPSPLRAPCPTHTARAAIRIHPRNKRPDLPGSPVREKLPADGAAGHTALRIDPAGICSATLPPASAALLIAPLPITAPVG